MRRQIRRIGGKQRRDTFANIGIKERLCHQGDHLVPLIAPRERRSRLSEIHGDGEAGARQRGRLWGRYPSPGRAERGSAGP